MTVTCFSSYDPFIPLVCLMAALDPFSLMLSAFHYASSKLQVLSTDLRLVGISSTGMCLSHWHNVTSPFKWPEPWFNSFRFCVFPDIPPKTASGHLPYRACIFTQCLHGVLLLIKDLYHQEINVIFLHHTTSSDLAPYVLTLIQKVCFSCLLLTRFPVIWRVQHFLFRCSLRCYWCYVRNDARLYPLLLLW